MKGVDIRKRVIEKAMDYGACLAGIADVAHLRKSPSHMIYGRLDDYSGVGTRPSVDAVPGVLAWPAGVKSVIVIAVEHPEQKPELDWWQEDLKGGTPGNHMLMEITDKLVRWLKADMGNQAAGLSYYLERGGVFLKDAAVLAGLGCIGKNNMLVTPEFGPRIRLRAMFVNELLPATHPIDFDPCTECEMPCREACPQSAFSDTIYSESEFNLAQLPARTGIYSRKRCNLQMEQDISSGDKIAAEDGAKPKKRVKYCRKCETACPVGQP